MNSPDPGSPISTDTSESPPPDDFQFSNRDQQQILSPADPRLSNIQSSFPASSTSGSSKRRLPERSSLEQSRRDPKSRRREDVMGASSSSRRMMVEGQGGHMVGGFGGPMGSGPFLSRGDYGLRRDKEELIDLSLVEQLRQDFGDPFLDSGLKHLS